MSGPSRAGSALPWEPIVEGRAGAHDGNRTRHPSFPTWDLSHRPLSGSLVSVAIRRAWPIIVVAVAAGCTGEVTEPVPMPSPTAESATLTAAPALSPTPTQPSAPTPTPTPVVFEVPNVTAVIDHLAGTIGPREASSPAFHQAADYVRAKLSGLGYQVSQAPVPVPAGISWGVEVEEGTSANVIADPPAFDSTRPHVVVGAHLDSVPQAPGAEDNASGVGVLIELARMAAAEPPRLPVRFVAFGAEEPRGEGDDLHHFGSQLYVRELTEEQRRAVAGMVSLDRVGVAADYVPVCTGGQGATDVRDALVAAAETVSVPIRVCENRASDHWSFEKAALPSARLGSIPYAGYHSPGDVPSVVDAGQLGRVGQIMWAWLRSL